MNDLCPGTLLFYCLWISFCPAGSHDAAKSEKGCRVGVAFRITVMQWLIVGVQKGALGALFFILLPWAAGAPGAIHTGGFHILAAILSVSCRQPLRMCARM